MGSPSTNPIRNLIREIHRRSLWQVLGIYLAGSWVAYEVAQGLTEGLGLPTWVPGVALVLLIIGLPIVMATAFVQEGGPEVSSADSVADLEDILSGDDSPGEQRTTVHRLFNWRNAILGGAAAFVLLTTVALAWMTFGQEDLVATLGSAFPGAGAEPAIDPSVAVMPCDDLSPAGDQAALAQGIADEVSMALSQLPDLKVSGRSSVTAMKAQEADLATISNTLGVANVLQCTLVRDGSAVRVNASLSEAETGSVLWSAQFNEEFTDLFGLLDSVAQGVSRELRVAMGRGEVDRLVAEGTTVPEAHEAYLRGRYLWNQRGEESLQNAITEFERATELDPGYAEAWSGLADSYLVIDAWTESTERQDYRTNRLQGLRSARRSVSLQPDLGMGHTSLGYALWNVGEWEEAEREYERALELNPGYGTAHHWYGYLLYTTARAQEALAVLERAVELDPVSLITSSQLALALEVTGRMEQAIEQDRETIRLAPGWGSGWYHLGRRLLDTGMYAEGREAWRRAGEIFRRNPQEWEAIYDGMVRFRETGEVVNSPVLDGPFWITIPIYIRLGQDERAVDVFENLVRSGALGYAALAAIYATGDQPPADPRYQALLDEAGITW